MNAALRAFGILLASVALASSGCGTTRMTDTSRSATEQLLVSQAIDNAVSRVDFTPMSGKRVFFEEKCLDGTVDKGYLASSLRQSMLAAGCVLVEEKAKAVYVVEARSGCIGTDKNSFLVGVPQMQLPSILPGTPPAIPEVPLIKSTAQEGVAKVAVFAYNRETGKAVWQSGAQGSVSTSKDAYVFGLGPIHRGTLKKENQDVVKQLDVFGLTEGEDPATASAGRQPHVTQTMAWVEPPAEKKPADGGTTADKAVRQAVATKPAK